MVEVSLPNTLKTIGEFTFFGCSSLTSVTIPDSVTNIGGYSFYNCSSLTNMVIPDSVTNIGFRVFADCKYLKKISCFKNNKKLVKKALKENGCKAEIAIIKE